jgi:hypothetical protein
VVPVIISTGLIFGGTTQLIGGLIQIGAGDALNGLLFCDFRSVLDRAACLPRVVLQGGSGRTGRPRYGALAL